MVSEMKDRILVVEDEQAICEICRRVLTAEGLEVEIANNGKAAQHAIEGRKYEVLLLDIRLPLMDGIQVYHWLQEKHPELADRVIFSTGSVIGEDTVAFLKQTSRPFLFKPVTPDELKEMVRKVIGRGET